MRSVTMDFLKKVLEAKCCNNYQEKRFERIVMQACTEFDFFNEQDPGYPGPPIHDAVRGWRSP